MIRREDITSRTTIDKEVNRTNLVSSLTFGSTIAFEGTSISPEILSGEAEEQRNRLMRHIYGDIDLQLSALHSEIVRLHAENSDKWKLLNMVSTIRSKLQ